MKTEKVKKINIFRIDKVAGWSDCSLVSYPANVCRLPATLRGQFSASQLKLKKPDTERQEPPFEFWMNPAAHITNPSPSKQHGAHLSLINNSSIYLYSGAPSTRKRSSCDPSRSQSSSSQALSRQRPTDRQLIHTPCTYSLREPHRPSKNVSAN
jgi:hypothetical protein